MIMSDIPRMGKLYKNDVLEESTHLGQVRYSDMGDAEMYGQRRIDAISTDRELYITVRVDLIDADIPEVKSAMMARINYIRNKRVDEMMSREYHGTWFRQ